MKKYAFAAVGAVLAMIGAPSAQAASCWSNAATHAARMRQLDVMLMVGSLRCRAGSNDYRNDYDRFLTRHRGALGVANRTMLSEFSAGMGQRGAMNALDRMSVTIANTYGGGAGMGCGELRDMAHHLSRASTAQVEQAADRVIADKVVTPTCSRHYARRR